jgi:uncharacterized protein with PQ loop repeat
VFFGPLAAAGQVIKTRTTRGMLFPSLVLTVVAALIWFGYGFYIMDIPIMIPNALGILFGIVQILLYTWAKKQEKMVSISSTDEGFAPVQGHDDVLLREESSSSIGLIRDDASILNVENA